ncbi:MAG: hypothetical protein KGY76_07530 [Candidatus Thermoplasmatota archaeon]|nr:hypothetical protein [Candidatus Thermoplasmatota archaeon]
MSSESSERFLLPIGLIIAPLLASLVSLHSVYWFFPILFGLVPLIGYLLKRSFFLDLGIALSILSFLFVNRGLTFSLVNLLTVVAVFFLFLAVWFTARNVLLIKRMRSAQDDTSTLGSIASYRKAFLGDIFKNIFAGAFLSIVASFLAMYSSIGSIKSSSVQMLLIVAFSTVVFFIIYLMIKMLTSDA